jgi:hypothetical protein
MSVQENLLCALNRYKASDFKQGGQHVMYWVGMYLLNIPIEEQPCMKFDMPTEEALISNKIFCDEINQESGKSILYPHDLAAYIQRDRQYFEGAYFQERQRTRIFVRKQKMLEKLKEYSNTTTNLREKIQEYLKMREQKTCNQIAQQLKFTDSDKHALI